MDKKARYIERLRVVLTETRKRITPRKGFDEDVTAALDEFDTTLLKDMAREGDTPERRAVLFLKWMEERNQMFIEEELVSQARIDRDEEELNRLDPETLLKWR